jgi:hypothetical protein
MSHWRQVELWEGTIHESLPGYPEVRDILFIKIVRDSGIVWAEKDYGILNLHNGVIFPAKIGQRIKLIVEIEDEIK